MGTAATGFVTGLTLIVAIGAQNAFVLRQGISGRYVLPVVAVCAAADAVLIAAGVAGLGTAVAAHPVALDVARYGGGAFLLGYAVLAMRRALRPVAMSAVGAAGGSLGAALLACLGFTFLNPHVYLDTVVLVGSVANQHGADGRWIFALGAMAASLTWFTALGFGARRLGPVFARASSWRILDALIAVVMAGLGLTLVFS